jgi:hypothetical protein
MTTLTLCSPTTAADEPATATVPSLAYLPERAKPIADQRDRAIDKALAPDVTADFNEAVEQLLTRFARNPRDLPGLLHDLCRRAYVNGRMDQASGDAVAAAQSATLADAALAQVISLTDRRGGHAS